MTRKPNFAASPAGIDGEPTLEFSTTSTDVQQQEIVAYLDGELDAENAQRVEARLAEDDAYRLQLQELQRAWDALDHLPKAEVDERFTRSTVEMVAVEAGKEADHSQRRAQSRYQLQWAGFVVAMLISAVGGYSIVSAILPPPGETEVVSETVPDSATDDVVEADNSPSSSDDILTAIKTLPRDERSRLLALLADEHGDELEQRQHREDFARWVADLSPEQRQRLKRLPPDEQMRQFEKHAEGQRLGRLASVPLSRQDMGEVLGWLDAFTQKHIEQWIGRLPEPAQMRIRRIDDERKQRFAVVMAYVLPYFRQHQKLPDVSEADFRELAGRLSGNPRELLLRAPKSEHRQRLLASWVRASLFWRLPATVFGRSRPKISRDALDRFYEQKQEEFSPEIKDRLASLREEDEDKYYQTLARLFMYHSRDRFRRVRDGEHRRGPPRRPHDGRPEGVDRPEFRGPGRFGPPPREG